MEVSVPQLPRRPNLDHLKKQAKDLLRLYQARDPNAFHRFRTSLPAAKDKDDTALTALGLRLHDAQSCVAREYGLASWDELRAYVQWGRTDDPDHLLHRWLVFVYGHGGERPRPGVAARMLEEKPDLVGGNPMLACAVGDEAAICRAIAQPDWLNQVPASKCPDCGAAIGRTPLVAVTHSSLARLAPFRDRLRRCVRLLLDAGADPNQRWSETADHALSALYGAAGVNHDAEMTRLLLAAGANPNDGESLYHAMESRDLTCAKLLLKAGATVEGSNALHHQLDADDLAGLRLLLAHTRDPNDGSSGLGNPLLWAIRRRRSRAHIQALLEAGADPQARTKEGISAYRQALLYGLTDAADLLLKAGASEPLSPEDQFVAACARGDKPEALRIQALEPEIVNGLLEPQVRQLPNLTEAGETRAVQLMVELGWPIDVRGGVGWVVSALNHAVARGDASLTRFLLEHGASWTEPNGHDDNVNGTLAWASRNEYIQKTEREGDWLGCAKALIEHGMTPDWEGEYADDVADYFATLRTEQSRG